MQRSAGILEPGAVREVRCVYPGVLPPPDQMRARFAEMRRKPPRTLLEVEWIHFVPGGYQLHAPSEGVLSAGAQRARLRLSKAAPADLQPAPGATPPPEASELRRQGQRRMLMWVLGVELALGFVIGWFVRRPLGALLAVATAATVVSCVAVAATTAQVAAQANPGNLEGQIALLVTGFMGITSAIVAILLVAASFIVMWLGSVVARIVRPRQPP